VTVTALRGSILAGLAAIVAVGCSSGTPSTPTPPSPPPVTGPPQGPPSTATIVIGSNNTFMPLEVTVAVGGRVSFENRNNRAFDIMSDPPLVHTDCPPVQEVGFIQPGQTKQTGVLNVAGVCGFHDHLNEHNPDLRGRIVVQ
jgi:hypothetical protein